MVVLGWVANSCFVTLCAGRAMAKTVSRTTMYTHVAPTTPNRRPSGEGVSDQVLCDGVALALAALALFLLRALTLALCAADARQRHEFIDCFDVINRSLGFLARAVNLHVS